MFFVSKSLQRSCRAWISLSFSISSILGTKLGGSPSYLLTPPPRLGAFSLCVNDGAPGSSRTSESEAARKARGGVLSQCVRQRRAVGGQFYQEGHHSGSVKGVPLRKASPSPIVPFLDSRGGFQENQEGFPLSWSITNCNLLPSEHVLIT